MTANTIYAGNASHIADEALHLLRMQSASGRKLRRFIQRVAPGDIIVTTYQAPALADNEDVAFCLAAAFAEQHFLVAPVHRQHNASSMYVSSGQHAMDFEKRQACNTYHIDAALEALGVQPLLGIVEEIGRLASCVQSATDLLCGHRRFGTYEGDEMIALAHRIYRVDDHGESRNLTPLSLETFEASVEETLRLNRESALQAA